MRCLLIAVRFHDGRYHGAGDWPPSPARLFQALVAGAARGRTLADGDRKALEWLEALDAPVIAAPSMRTGQGFRNYVPNNDLDAVGGDLRRISEIRAPKMIRPRLFDAAQSLLYAWFFPAGESGETHARAVAAIAEKMYQLGRGVDMAWGSTEVVAADEAEARLARHGGALHRPGRVGGGAPFPCPERGSLRGLEERFRANQRRFTAAGGRGERLFSQAPKPRFRTVPYDCPPVRQLFDLRRPGDAESATNFAWPLAETVALATTVRDRAAARLKKALPADEALIDRVLVGRDATEADKALRVRIVPLPSIGHVQADRQIRRILVEIPPNCPLPAGPIVERGFSGLHLGMDPATGEIVEENRPVLTPATDDSMLRHYSIGPSRWARLWRSVTPVALSQVAARRRIDPARLGDPAQQKGAVERLEEERRATRAVVQAVRHADLTVRALTVRVQREPFAARGERAETFAVETRFAKQRLWHVEIAFIEPVPGPLILGDGRYLGLGLLAPMNDARPEVMTFALGAEARIRLEHRASFLLAVRRALMALSRRADGSVPPLFSGHELDGSPARSGQHRHVFLAAADFDGDGLLDRLIIAAPWTCDRSVKRGTDEPALFDRTVSALEVVRAGKLGVVMLTMNPRGTEDQKFLGPARVWESHASYSPTRPVRRGDDPIDVLRRDAVIECRRRCLPTPDIEVLEYSKRPCDRARLRLSFGAGVYGPILLGKESHRGAGLFLPVT